MTHAGAKFYIQSEIINLNLIALKKAALGKNVPIKKVQLMNKKNYHAPVCYKATI